MLYFMNIYYTILCYKNLAAIIIFVFCYRLLSPLLVPCVIWPRTQTNSRNYLKKYCDMYLTRINQLHQTF